MSSSTNITGSLVSGPTAGFAVTRLLAKLAAATGDRGSAHSADIYEAITATGRAAATWKGEDWWWMHGTGSFSATDGIASYAMRTVNSASMANFYSVERMFLDDDWQITAIPYYQYHNWYTTVQPTQSESQPVHYAQTGEPPYVWLQPVPDTTYTINVVYKKQHPVIDGDSVNADLLVPAEFQHGIYYEGALWLLKTDISGGHSLEECPGFVEAIDRMYQNQPANSDWREANMLTGAPAGLWPFNQRVVDGGIVTSVTDATPS